MVAMAGLLGLMVAPGVQGAGRCYASIDDDMKGPLKCQAEPIKSRLGRKRQGAEEHRRRFLESLHRRDQHRRTRTIQGTQTCLSNNLFIKEALSRQIPWDPTLGTPRVSQAGSQSVL